MGITVADGMRLGMGLILDGMIVIIIVVGIAYLVNSMDDRWF
jgi:hypothetical protein